MGALKNLALAVLLGLAASYLLGFAGMAVSPWLALTLWMAISEGWLYGLGAAGVACALVAGERALRGMPVAEPSVTYSLLVASALYAGALADANRRRVRLLRDTVALQAEELMRRRERQQVLERANIELKASIAEQQGGLATLYEIFRRLSSPDEAVILDVVKDFLKAEQCSLYRLEGRQLRLAAQYGWAAAPEEVLELGDDLLSQAVEEKELRTLRDFPLERLTGRDSVLLRLMAAPILHPVTGQCLGAISVESLPFSHFTKPTAKLLETIAELAGRTLAVEAPPPEHEWLGADLFARRLSGELLQVSRGSRAPFSLLWVGAPAWANLPVEVRRLAERGLSLLLAANLRPSDLRGRVPEGVVGVVLSGGGLETLVRELTQDLGDYLARWIPELAGTQLELGLASSEGVDEAPELLARARNSARPCAL